MALLATNRFAGDGATTSYEFNFVGKYIARSHVKVYQEDNATKVRTYVPITDGNFLNDTTLRSLPVTPVGQTLVIYRDTPKPPIVDFVNGSRFTEYNLDLVARQGLFVAMEAMDAGGAEARQQLLDAIAVVVGLVDDAAAAALATQAALDSFDDRYLGQKPADPANDNDGDALLVGALYFRTTAPIGMKVWTGAAWDDAYANLSSKFDKTGGDISGNVNLPSLNGGQLAGMRNKIINGDFRINQRTYASGAATTAGQYTLDRWKVTGTGGVTFSTTAGKTTVTIPAGQTLQQVIEGLNLQSGTYVLSWEGTAKCRVGAGAYGSSGAVTAAITGGTNTTIEFNAGTVANVQFEPGTIATPFENRPYGLELALCQRYYEEVAYRVDTALTSAAIFGSVFIAYKATKRTQPTLSHKALDVNNCALNSFQSQGVHGCTPAYQPSSAAGVATATLVADAEL